MNEYTVTLKVLDGLYQAKIVTATITHAGRIAETYSGSIVDIVMTKRGVVPFDLSSGTSEA
jgi:hypothetical protein